MERNTIDERSASERYIAARKALDDAFELLDEERTAYQVHSKLKDATISRMQAEKADLVVKAESLQQLVDTLKGQRDAARDTVESQRSTIQELEQRIFNLEEGPNGQSV